ncbi:hypothetical protein EJ110_NYTH29410 [Nymphaea thermarum]|nr:hypothetical protein EJ110_NYTH29410 [Nymphaea thermarum]
MNLFKVAYFVLEKLMWDSSKRAGAFCTAALGTLGTAAQSMTHSGEHAAMHGTCGQSWPHIPCVSLGRDYLLGRPFFGQKPPRWGQGL